MARCTVHPGSSVHHRCNSILYISLGDCWIRLDNISNCNVKVCNIAIAKDCLNQILVQFNSAWQYYIWHNNKTLPALDTHIWCIILMVEMLKLNTIGGGNWNKKRNSIKVSAPYILQLNVSLSDKNVIDYKWPLTVSFRDVFFFYYHQHVVTR